ncbi:hypothetical protein LOB43_10920, partial [Lactobacillus delbrueckii subsp. lactis]|nr:hypothetical protein [Lactobacillus delbrueckii subsp. lactis]
KAGNPCHIADYYEKRKRSSETASHKKAAIASIHKLLRTIFALELYNFMCKDEQFLKLNSNWV